MTESFVEYVRDQLQQMRSLTFRRMFGGYGLYGGEKFFGILHRDRLYFKTDAENRAAYVKLGMQPFRASAKQTLTNYYEVPPEVLDDAERLVEWARQSLAVAERASQRAPKRAAMKRSKVRYR